MEEELRKRDMEETKAIFEKAGLTVRVEEFTECFYNIFVENDLYKGCFSSSFDAGLNGALIKKEAYSEIDEDIYYDKHYAQKSAKTEGIDYIPLEGKFWATNAHFNLSEEDCILKEYNLNPFEIETKLKECL